MFKFINMSPNVVRITIGSLSLKGRGKNKKVYDNKLVAISTLELPRNY